MFFFRSGWQPRDVYLALHNSPAALSRHDQPDNGTFELYAFGRWLMPDSGSYAYEDTPHANERDWFRQTKVHNTLTLDGGNSVNASTTRLWKDLGASGVVTFENASYPNLTHRRTVFFVDGRYFVFLDEALGSAKGALDLHFQFAPGPFTDERNHTVHTALPGGGNVAVWEAPQAPVSVIREKGQTSSKFNIKEDRPAIAYRARAGAPFVFLTVVVPYATAQAPPIRARFAKRFAAGDASAAIDLSIGSEHWALSRDLAAQTASVQSPEAALTPLDTRRSMTPASSI